jgi:ATP-dependent protease Clp ATPase subunit
MARIKKARVLRMLFCDFCGAGQDKRQLMIQGRDEVHICNKCVDVCLEMLVEHEKSLQPALLEASQREGGKG